MSKQITELNVGRGISSATLDGIPFNNIQWNDGQGATKRRTRSTQPWDQTGSTTISDFAVNAVDIDWNEAVVNTGFLSDHSKTIKTTGDLLYWLQQDLITASQQVSTLEGQVTDLQSTNEALTERIVKLETLVSGLYSALADDTSNS